MYDQLTLFLPTKSSILLQLLQHTKKIIAFLSTWSILYNFKKSREKWQKSSPFLFEFPFCFFNSLSSKFWPTIPIVEPRWNGLIDKIYSRHRRIGEKSGESGVRHGERLDFRLVIEKAGLIVQRWKLISKIQLAAASLSRDLLSMRLDFGRNRWQLRGRSW